MWVGVTSWRVPTTISRATAPAAVEWAEEPQSSSALVPHRSCDRRSRERALVSHGRPVGREYTETTAASEEGLGGLLAEGRLS